MINSNDSKLDTKAIINDHTNHTNP